MRATTSMPPACTSAILFSCVCVGVCVCVYVLEVDALLAGYPDIHLSWTESQGVILKEAV